MTSAATGHPTRVAVVGGRGKTGRAVGAALSTHGAAPVPLGRSDFHDLPGALAGCAALYLIAPNLHPDEPGFVAEVLTAAHAAAVPRVVYHSVASPYAPAMPHHLGKAMAEDLVRRSGLEWTILQPGAYLQNLDLTGPITLPYSDQVAFGFADLGQVGEAAARVLLEDGHHGAGYELATRTATVAELAAEAGVPVHRIGIEEWAAGPGAVLDPREREWLAAMFDYYDRHGLPVGTRPLRMLIGTETDPGARAPAP